MVRLTLILSVMISFANLFAQSGKAEIKLNALDFSRFPQSDLFVTLTTAGGQILNLDTNDLEGITIQHDRYTVKPQSIQSVYELKKRGQSELYIGLVFDNSESMSPRIQLLEKAAERFVAGLDIGDYASVFDFGDEINKVTVPEFKNEIYARQRIRYSSSKTFLYKAVKNINFSKRTYMYDALLYALSLTNKVESLGKKVIVFFSDGVNIGSEASPELIAKYSAEYDIPIYAIDLNIRENAVLKRIAASSGGEYFFVTKPEDLLSLYESLINLLKSQYRITYNFPSNIVDQSGYNINFRLSSSIKGSAARNFQVDGEKIGYYNLLYYQSTGKEDMSNFINFVSSYPESKWRDDAEFLLGNYWFRRNDYSRALAVYNRILRDTMNSAYSPALAQKAKLLTEANQLALARKEYKQILKSSDNSLARPRAMIDLAKSYSTEGNYSLALDTYSNLISEYQGTEFASEALLQSASISMTMGELSKARGSLNELLTNYPESKNSVYAKMELAKIEAQNNNPKNAIELYSNVIKSNPPAEVLEEAKLKYADLNYETGNYTEAIDTYKDLSVNAGSPSLKNLALTKLIPAYLATGALVQSREVFSDLPSELKSQLIKSETRFKVNTSGEEGTALANSAFRGGGFNPSGGVIKIYDNPELRAKFPVIGPMYQISALPGTDLPATVSFTIEKGWIRDKLLDKSSSGVYRLENTTFVPVETNRNFAALGFDIKNAPPGIYAILTQEPEVITLYNINFDLGKATIRKDAERNLYRVIDMLRYQPALTLEIAGHTDSTGSDDINYNLSLSRAEGIKNFMVLNGVDPARLTTRGYGSQFPLAPNSSDENRQKNRRTEFIVLKGNLLTDGSGSNTERYAVSLGAFLNSKEVQEKKNIYKVYFPELSVLIITKENQINYLLTLGIHNSYDDAKKELERFREMFNSVQAEIIKL